MTVEKEVLMGEVSANAATPTVMYRLPPGITRVDVTYPSGTTATLTPKTTQAPQNTANLAPIYADGEEVSITGTDAFEVRGPGWLCFIVASFSGSSPISIFGSR